VTTDREAIGMSDSLPPLAVIGIAVAALLFVAGLIVIIVASDSGLRDFIEFRAFITPAIMTIVWVLGAALITLVAVLTVVNDTSSLLPALLYFLVGNLGWRVFVEVLVVVFSIHDSLRKIEKK
jgi:hypothetical protein